MKKYIWGAGLEGIRALYNLCEERIFGIIDSQKKGKVASYEIISPDLIEYDDDNYFFIATSDDSYFKVKEFLENRGYKEFDSFINWRCYKKKICLLNDIKVD